MEECTKCVPGSGKSVGHSGRHRKWATEEEREYRRRGERSATSTAAVSEHAAPPLAPRLGTRSQHAASSAPKPAAASETRKRRGAELRKQAPQQGAPSSKRSREGRVSAKAPRARAEFRHRSAAKAQAPAQVRAQAQSQPQANDLRVGQKGSSTNNDEPHMNAMSFGMAQQQGAIFGAELAQIARMAYTSPPVYADEFGDHHASMQHQHQLQQHQQQGGAINKLARTSFTTAATTTPSTTIWDDHTNVDDYLQHGACMSPPQMQQVSNSVSLPKAAGEAAGGAAGGAAPVEPPRQSAFSAFRPPCPSAAHFGDNEKGQPGGEGESHEDYEAQLLLGMRKDNRREILRRQGHYSSTLFRLLKLDQVIRAQGFVADSPTG